MFGKKKNEGVCKGFYTGEGVLDGKRYNECGGVDNKVGNTPVETYLPGQIVFNGANDRNGTRFPIYEYEVNGVTYKRAGEYVSYNKKKIESMKGVPCKVVYDLNNPEKSKAKKA